MLTSIARVMSTAPARAAGAPAAAAATQQSTNSNIHNSIHNSQTAAFSSSSVEEPSSEPTSWPTAQAEVVYSDEPAAFSDALSAEDIEGKWVGWTPEAHAKWYPDAAASDQQDPLHAMLGPSEPPEPHHATLVRPITTAVIRRLRTLGADPSTADAAAAAAAATGSKHTRKNPLRHAVVLTGPAGIGKSTLADTAVAWAKSAGWIVIHAPSAVELVRGRGIIAPAASAPAAALPAAAPVATATYDHPVATLAILRRLRTDYSQQMSQVPMLDSTADLAATKTLVQGASTDGGSSLADALDVARTRPGDTMTIFNAVFAALAEQTEVPVLVAMDNVDAVYGPTGFTSSTGFPIYGPQLTHLRAMLSLARTVKRGAGLFTTDLTDLSSSSDTLADAADAADALRGLAAENPVVALKEMAVEKARAEALADGLDANAYDEDVPDPSSDEIFAARRAVDKRLAKHAKVAWEAELMDTLGQRSAKYVLPALTREETGLMLNRLAAADSLASDVASDPVAMDSIHVLCSGIPGEIVDMAAARFE